MVLFWEVTGFGIGVKVFIELSFCWYKEVVDLGRWEEMSICFEDFIGVFGF